MREIKILLVEDEQSIRIELSTFLKRFAKAGIYVAKNGEEGLKLYHSKQPDIIVADINMPKMTGIEMVREIKRDNPDQVVILATAFSDNIHLMEAIELQVEGYITKPVNLKLLETKIKKFHKQISYKYDYVEQKKILNEIAHLQGNMLVVLNKEKKRIFVNKKLLAFWNAVDIHEIEKNNYFMNTRFVEQKGSFYPKNIDKDTWIEELSAIDESQRIVTLKNANNNIKTYMVDITVNDDTGHTIIVFSEITHLMAEKSLYQKKAYTDELTGIFNRTMFDDYFHRFIEEVKKNNTNLCLILMDIDFFKKVNDEHGHLIGDKVLIEFSNLISGHIRTKDIFARWGGEEFVLLLPDTTSIGAEILAENLRILVQNHLFINDLSLTSSFGVVCANKNSFESLESLFAKADKSLYTAKESGRNRVIRYHESCD